MDEVGLWDFDTVGALEKRAPSVRPRFTPPADGSPEEELRCALVAGLQMLHDWVAAGGKAARRAALRGGASAFADPDEARFHELYREAYAELFEIKYGHEHTVDEDEWENWVVFGNGTRVPPAVAATMLSPP